MLRPEVCPQVHDLPRTQTDQHAHCGKREPLDPLICALIRISEFLLATAEVVHLANDLAHHFLNSAQLSFDRLQLLTGLNGGPVFCVGANIDVEFDVPGRGIALVWVHLLVCCAWSCDGRRMHTSSRQYVVKAYVEGRVSVRGEGVAVLAVDVLGPAVIVAHSIADLVAQKVS